MLEKSKNTLKLEVVNPDDTVIYPLISQLLKDGRVADARYITGHPQLDKPTISLESKEGKPQDILREVALDLAGRYGEMKEKLRETLGQEEASRKE